MRSGRVMRRPKPSLKEYALAQPQGGRPPKHGREFRFAKPDTWGEPDVALCGSGGLLDRRRRVGLCRSRYGDQLAQSCPGSGVGGAQEGSGRTTGEEDFVGVVGQVEEGDGVGAAERGGPAGLRVGEPPVLPPYEVVAEDDAVPVVLEALGGVDAANLAEVVGVGGPQPGRGGTPSRRDSPRRFHGLRQDPIVMSSTRRPRCGSLHRQQKPAVMRAVIPPVRCCASLACRRSSICWGESTTRTWKARRPTRWRAHR
jgi:hypothetical protein